MPLQKQPIDYSFAQGLDLKTDPKRVPIGKFLRLQNSVFTKSGLLTKRNGFPSLSPLPVTNTQFLTTFNGDLSAIGSSIYAYDTPNKRWINKAALFPCELSVLPIVRSNTNQSQADSVVAANGLMCTVYTDQSLTNLNANIYKYVVADSVSGQNIVAPTQLTEADATYGTPRVFLLVGYFVILYTQNVAGTYHLRYLAISTADSTITVGPSDIASGVNPNVRLSFDGFVTGVQLFIAYSELSGGQAFNITYLQNVAAGPASPVQFTGYSPKAMSVTSDGTTVYAAFCDTNTYTLAVDLNLNVVFSPVQSSTSEYVALASCAYNGTFYVFTDVPRAYPDGVTPTNSIGLLTVTQSPHFSSVFSSGVSTITASSATGLSPGMVLVDNTNAAHITPATLINSITGGTTLHLSTTTAGNSASSPGDQLVGITVVSSQVKRSLGLASKAFIYNGVPYVLCAYGSTYQPTYFLIDVNGNIIAKLAYSNAASLNLTTLTLPYLVALPNITLVGNVASIAYLVKEAITAVNKSTALSATNNVAGIYAQAGINLATFTLGTSSVSSSEAAQTLNLSGGFVWSYDGYVAVEQNFFVWPDYVTATWTENSIETPTGTVASGSFIVTAISSMSGISVGMTITDSSHAYIPANTKIKAILSASSVQMSAAATGSATADNLSIQGNIAAESDGINTNAYFYSVIYAWSDNQGNRNVSAPSIPVAVTTSASAARGINTLAIATDRLTYKTANPIKLEIYRWSIAQPVYYQVTSVQIPLLNSVSADTVTFVDPYADADILGNEILYTTGGVVENISPPATSITTLFQTRMWVVDAEDGNLLWFSKQIIETTPIEFSDLFTLYISPTVGAQGSTGPITALAPLDDKLIIWKRNAIYYLSGAGPDNTGANNQFNEPTFVSSTIGCVNQQSIVFIPSGLMFESDKGIWLLGRDLNTTFIGSPVETLTQGATVVTALNIPGTTQVRFTLSSGVTLMYDYFYQQWGEFVGIPGVSSTLFQNLHTFVNSLGQVFQELPGTYLDGTSPVLMSFTTAWVSLAGLQGFERFYALYLLGQYLTPFKLNVQFAYDYNPTPTQSVIVTPQNYQPNWGVDPLWGSDPLWGGINQVLDERVFPASQKCETFSLTVDELYDPSFGVIAGAGLTLSGLSLIVGVKRGFRTQSAGKSSG